MKKREWVLLFRREGESKVYIYEPLTWKQILNKRSQGWKVIS